MPKRMTPKKKPVIIDVEPEGPKRLPAASKKVTISRKGEKGYNVDVPLEDPEIQDGDMLNAAKADMTKVPQKTGYATVGLSLGATLNLGDYQSARIDCFIIRNVPDNDKDIHGAMTDISRKLNKELNRQANILNEEAE